MKTLVLTAGLTGLIALGSAHAQERERPQVPITKEKVLERAEERFRKMDLDGNGSVTEEELAELSEKRRRDRRRRMFDRQDSNDDNVLSLDEILKTAESRFDRVDQDGDGVISEDEAEARRAGWKNRSRRGG